MDVFDLRQRLIEDYAEYMRGFLDIADPRLRGLVDQHLADGLLWPHPKMSPLGALSLRTRCGADSGHEVRGEPGGRPL